MPRKNSKSKKKSKSVKSKRSKKMQVQGLKRRIDIAWRSFITFFAIFIASFILYFFSTNKLFENLFGLLMIIFGFFTLAFLISFVVLMIIRSGKGR